jgi:hypothetical protein
MSYPSVHYGSYGDEKVTSTSKINGLPLGMKMELPDGRVFRHARVSATAMVVGKLYQGVAAVADTAYQKTLAVSSGGGVGSTTVVITAGGTTAVTTDQFAEGEMIVASSAAAGSGHLYKVKSCSSAAAGSAITVTLYETDPIKVALAAGTTTVGLRESPYSNVLLTTADTVIAGKPGVSCSSAAASSYVWLATKGDAPVNTAGTVLVDGEVCVASTAVAGAVAAVVASTAGITSAKAGANIVGRVRTVAAANGYAIVDLMLE